MSRVRKQLSYLLAFLIFTSLLQCFSNQVFCQTVLKGGIRTVVEKGQTVKINFNTPVNFYFTDIGDMIAAFTQEDIYIGDEIYIPRGSRIEGVITNVKSPKHFGLDGAFEIDFNEIVTPSQVSIPIYASVSTDISTTPEKVAGILTYDSALVAYGTFHGLVAGYQYVGLPLAITSHGISLLAGAGIGAGAGLIGSVVRKGNIPQVLTGISRDVVLKSDFVLLGELPKIKEEARSIKHDEQEYKGFRFYPSVRKEDIGLVINKIKKEHSKTYGNYIILEINLKNNSPKSVSLSNLVLLNKFESQPLHADLFLSGTQMFKTLKSLDEVNISLAFLITDKIENYSLALIDPLDESEIVRVPLMKYNLKL